MANPFDGETFDFWWMRLAPGFIPVARSVSRTLTSTSSSRRSNGSIAMQRIARGEGGRGQPCYEEKKRDGDKGGEREREDRVEGRSERTAGKIGGGSQQLLAGMSGNAWDSDPKGPSHDKRPRDPWPPSSLSLSVSLTGDQRSNEIVIDRPADRCSKFVWARKKKGRRIGGEILSLSWDDGKGEAVGTRPRRGETCYLTVLILDFSFVIVESGSRGGG